MHPLKSLVVFLFFAVQASATTPPVIQKYMELNQNVWNSGRVCRHAAVAMADLAEVEGREYVIPILETGNEADLPHVVFVLRYGDYWYAIDSTRNFKGKYEADYRIGGMQGEEDVAFYEDLSQRGLTKLVGYVSDDLLDFWRNEEEEYGRIQNTIEVNLERLAVMKKHINKIQEFVAELLDRMAEYNSQQKTAE
jgi:hypothetical protein